MLNYTFVMYIFTAKFKESLLGATSPLCSIN